MSSFIIYRQSDLARLFRVSRQTIHAWKKSGKLPQPQKIGNIPYWTETQIGSFLASNADKEETAQEAIHV